MAALLSFPAFSLWSGITGFFLVVLCRVTPAACQKPVSRVVGAIFRIPFLSTGWYLGDVLVSVFFLYWLISGYHVYTIWTAPPETTQLELGAIPQGLCKMWRYQRNCYIAGFSFMCWWSLKILLAEFQAELAVNTKVSFDKKMEAKK